MLRNAEILTDDEMIQKFENYHFFLKMDEMSQNYKNYIECRGGSIYESNKYELWKSRDFLPMNEMIQSNKNYWNSGIFVLMVNEMSINHENCKFVLHDGCAKY